MSTSWNAIGRPTIISEIVGQPKFTQDALEWSKKGVYPDALLFVGPSGVGKTTSARVLARYVMKHDMNAYESDFFECNASDERGIDFIRDNMKTYVTTAPLVGDRKVLLLDEADGLTGPAQDAARQIIENHVDNCLFILTANDISKIKPAIKSRCTVYNFKPVDLFAGSDHLYNVCEKAQVAHSVREAWREFFPRLVRQMDGDLRSCVNVLQALEQKDTALEKALGDLGDISKAAMGAMTDDYMAMRLQFYQSLDKGSNKMAIMKSFYRNLTSFFEIDEEGKVWVIMRVYGDMMSKIYEWPDTDYAFLDYFVAKVKGEIENDE